MERYLQDALALANDYFANLITRDNGQFPAHTPSKLGRTSWTATQYRVLYQSLPKLIRLFIANFSELNRSVGWICGPRSVACRHLSPAAQPRAYQASAYSLISSSHRLIFRLETYLSSLALSCSLCSAFVYRGTLLLHHRHLNYLCD